MPRNHATTYLIAIAAWTAASLITPSPAVGQTPRPSAPAVPAERADEPTQPADQAETEAVDTPETEEVEIQLTDPRAAMESFLAAADAGDYAKAARVIDFASMPEPPEQTKRENLAFKLAEVISSRPDIEVSHVSDDPDGEPVRLPVGAAEQPIELESDDEGQWRFTTDTVAQIAPLYEESTAEATEQLAEEVGVAEEDDEAAGTTDPDTRIASELDSPRETMQTFLTLAAKDDYATAARTMDFSLLPDPPTDVQKANLAWKLKEVIDRMQWVNYAKIPTHAEGEPFLFPIGAVSQPIAIARGSDGNWRFTRETVARIDDLYNVWRDRPKLTQGLLPQWMRTPLVAGNEGWRILALFLSILASLLLAQVARWVLQQPAKGLERRQPILSAFFQSLARSITPLVMWVGLWLGLQWLLVDDVVRGIIDTVLDLLVVLAIANILYRLVDVVDVWLREFAGKRASKLDDMLAPFVRRSIRATVVILALVQMASILSDQPPASIIAGLGVASIAIGLAAQDTIKNLFGSVMLIADRPFEVGDRVVIDGHDGPIEAVGFRSTRIRTLEGHLVTVPNGELANRTIQNVGKRPHIRRVMNLTITYDTSAAKIERAVEIVKEILADHEGMHADFPPRVYFSEFNDTSLSIFVIYWYHPADYWAYCEFSEKVNLQIFRRFEEEGIEFAFPTQTLFVASDPRRPLYALAGRDDAAQGNGRSGTDGDMERSGSRGGEG